MTFMRLTLFVMVALGLAGVAFFGYFALQDWAALQKNYAQFARLTPQSSVGAILLADARQNIHRINVFADGTWTLLCAIIAAIGVHGLAATKK
jgi:hypothetical protein